MAQVLAASFGPDPLFQHMFPHREQYPQDFMRALRENLLLSWWDYQKVLTVSYEVRSDNGRGGTNERQKLLHAGGREEITGLAEWERVGKGWQEVHGIWGWWDPSESIHNHAYTRLTMIRTYSQTCAINILHYPTQTSR